jgi:hypothetical protein
MGEVLIYEGALTPQDMAATYAYLEAKYIPEPSAVVLMVFAALALPRRRVHRRGAEAAEGNRQRLAMYKLR